MKHFASDVVKSFSGCAALVTVTIASVALCAMVAVAQEWQSYSSMNLLRSTHPSDAVVLAAEGDAAFTGRASQQLIQIASKSDVSLAYSKGWDTTLVTLCDPGGRFTVDIPTSLRAACTEHAAVLSLREDIPESNLSTLHALDDAAIGGRHSTDTRAEMSSPAVLVSPRVEPFADGLYLVAGDDAARHTFYANAEKYGFSLATMNSSYAPPQSAWSLLPWFVKELRVPGIVALTCFIAGILAASYRLETRTNTLKVLGVGRAAIVARSLVTLGALGLGCAVSGYAVAFCLWLVTHPPSSASGFNVMVTSAPLCIAVALAVSLAAAGPLVIRKASRD